jgi:hypothetical protein
MSDGTNPGLSGAIPPGWYADPAGGDGKRWWDGAQWTSHTQDPPAAPPPTFGNYIPVEQRSFQPAAVADAGTAYTRAAWWIAFSPVWSIVSQVIVVESVMAITPTPFHDFVPALIAINLLVWAVLVALAFNDRIKLLSLGNNSAASPWLVLLTPIVYLVIRARHVQLYATGAWAMVIWWCIAVFVTPGLAVLGFFGAFGIFGGT